MLYFVRQILLQSTRRVFYITIIVFYRPYSRKGEKTIKCFGIFFYSFQGKETALMFSLL